MTHLRPDAHRFRLVEADDAGEWFKYAPDGVVEQCREAGILTHRQCDAAHRLAECYARGGGAVPDRRHSFYGGTDDEEATARYRAEYRELLGAAPIRTQWALQTLCQDRFVLNILLWREGLDAIADRLRLAKY
jgi:hypothetical protein